MMRHRNRNRDPNLISVVYQPTGLRIAAEYPEGWLQEAVVDPVSADVVIANNRRYILEASGRIVYTRNEIAQRELEQHLQSDHPIR